ncbi:PIN-like domain-containing protein [Lysinibacillus xylanilyticus]|uniref:PIN-like domain-containing protein n=1 Tax=Lysinibacillus xylanilyticus TaxID=582475 RepID=UPI003D97661D
MTQNIQLDDFKKLIQNENTRVVFDTSGLLHLFECSPNLTTKILNNLEKIEDKLWIPEQVHNEYLRNKDKTKQREMNKFKNIFTSYQKKIDSLENEFGKLNIRYKNFNFNGIDELDTSLVEGINQIKQKLNQYKEARDTDEQENKLLLREEGIETFIQKIIGNGNIGEAFSLEELLSIYQEGEVRFKYAIPPGYKDVGKDDTDNEKTAKFGDLIVWKEILKIAKESNKNIIFVMEDNKPDWWEKNNNEKTGPRKELIKEFHDVAGKENEFLMLGTNQFSSFLSRMYEEIKDAIESFIDDNCTDILLNSIEEVGLDNLIELYTSLTSRFINNGELQQYLDYPLKDVEVEGFDELKIEEINVDFLEQFFEIEARFTASIDVTVESSLSSEFVQYDKVDIEIAGKINSKYRVDYSKYEEEFDLEKLEAENVIIQYMLVYQTDVDFNGDIDSLMQCKDCYKPGFYQHSSGSLICEKCADKYFACPNCGIYFDILFGAFCETCGNN